MASARLVCLSDTHGREDQITVPEADILVYAGDYSMRGTIAETERFAKWISGLPHKNILITYGNHELGAEKDPATHTSIIESARANVKVVLHERYELDGVKFFLSPYQPWFHNWAFNVQRGPAIAALWKDIPNDTEVLVTHGPAHGVLDQVESFGGFINVGCEDLLNRINDLKKLKLAVAGHLHLNGGQQVIKNNIIFVNSAVCDEEYKPVNKINVVEI